MESVYQVAILGCGAISQTHAEAIAHSRYAHLAAVCDCREDIARQAGLRYGVSAYSNVEDLLCHPGLDAVHICLPHWLHAPMAIRIAKAGKHILCEKPVAVTLEEAAEMDAAARSAGVALGICLQNRYNTASRYCRQVLQAGQLGRVLGGRAAVLWDRDADYYQSSDWRGRWKTEGGGVLINQSIHTLDLLQWLIDSPVTELTASVSTKRLSGVIEVEDTADALLRFENGARAVFFATNSYVTNAPIELEIVCEAGQMRIVGSDVMRTEKGVTTLVNTTMEGQPDGKDYWGFGHKLLIDDFYRCIAEGERFPIGVAEAVISLKLIDGFYRSSGQKAPVKLAIGGKSE